MHSQQQWPYSEKDKEATKSKLQDKHANHENLGSSEDSSVFWYEVLAADICKYFPDTFCDLGGLVSTIRKTLKRLSF